MAASAATGYALGVWSGGAGDGGQSGVARGGGGAAASGVSPPPTMSPAFAAAHARLLADASFQFAFLPYVEPKTPSWLLWLGRVLKPIAPALPWVFWGAVALGGGLILVLVGREVLRQARGRGGVGVTVLTGGPLAPSRQRVRALLAEADRLAAAGRFGEAARVLLLRTLDDLDERRPGLLGPAQTAREIAALEALPAAVREPLAGIARAVERFLFAGRPLDAEAFQAARADYGRFVEAASAR